jgi:hypothetical protein
MPSGKDGNKRAHFDKITENQGDSLKRRMPIILN